MTRSSPGAARLRASSSVRYRATFPEAATASAGGSGADDGASSVVNQLPRRSRSGSGTPSSSLITVNGSGKAKPLTRSTTVSPRALRSSSNRSTIAWTRGRRSAIRGRLNAAEASRRSRVWSGGSTLSMCRAKAGPGRPSATTAPSRASAACRSARRRRCTPLRPVSRTRTIWRYWPVPALSGLLPPSPAPPGSGCPQLRLPAATGKAAKVSHLHSNLSASRRTHDLRHTGDHLASRAGASTRELMYRMGHASERAALIYQHATRERDRQIAQDMDRLIQREARRSVGRQRRQPGTKTMGTKARQRTTGRLIAR